MKFARTTNFNKRWVFDMQNMGFRSVLVLAKIGHDLRKEFANTFDDDAGDAFGPLLEVLDGTRNVLRLAADEYKWVSDAAFFEACGMVDIERPTNHAHN